KLFERIPWRDGYIEEHRLSNGDVLRIKKFYGDCEPEPIYTAAEGGVPAVKFRLYHPERFDMTEWLAADPTMMSVEKPLALGKLLLWQADDAQLAHFLNAVPRDSNFGLLGVLGYSHGGKHFTFEVDRLRKGPIDVPETKTKIELVEYLPNARLEGAKWVSEGDVPENPMLRLKVTPAEGAPQEALAFGIHPEWQPLLLQRFSTDHLFTYFPADLGATAQVVVSRDGRMGYRAFGSAEGLIAAAEVKEDQEYPCWVGMKFVPKRVLASAKPDLRLRPKLLKRGDNQPTRACVVEIDSGKEKKETNLVCRFNPRSLKVGGREFSVQYDVERVTLPFKVRLDTFDEPKNPGTEMAAMYTSYVTVLDDKGGAVFDPLYDKVRRWTGMALGLHEPKPKAETGQHVVTMNEPLHYRDFNGKTYTFYQSGIDRTSGQPVSTFTVARDPGLLVKYAGAMIISFGIFLMFYMGGYFRKSRPRKDKTPAAADLEAEVDKRRALAGVGV
ncbi:MAG: hypothetical protein ACRDD1_03785, partial [Planctomycetia bacterium]